MRRRIETSPAPFQPLGDRFVKEYKPGLTKVEDIYAEYAKIDEIEGVGIGVPLAFGSVEKTREVVKSIGKEVSTIAPDTYERPGIRHGMLMNRDAGIRREEIAMVKESMDVCAELKGQDILLWLAQDAYQYPFEDDYAKRMDFLMESLDEICGYRDDVKVTIEYKFKEPKAYQYISDVGKSLFICEKIGRDNLGVVVDIGHSLIVRENPAEALALAAKYGKLFHVHLNDNYRSTDDDMIVGSVHFWETLEFFYKMDEVGYDGYLNLDIWPAFIDDGKTALIESIKRVRMFERLAEALPMKKIQQLQAENKTIEIMEILRETCIK